VDNYYEIVGPLAVLWDADMAARFPHASHDECRCEAEIRSGTLIQFQCIGWHCNRCGVSTNSQGGQHGCPDRPS
jgi:hypothetical protein